MRRRHLRFSHSDEVVADVTRLRHAGYTRLGNLDLAQICTHLADASDAYIDGFSIKVPWWMRLFVAPIFKRIVLGFSWIPAGVRVPDDFMPRPGGDVDASIERLQKCLARFDAHQDPFSLHPFLGRLTPAEYRKLSLLHCAHHLGFLMPNEAPVTADTAPASPPTAPSDR
jgi:hypothetical protein